MLTLAASGQCTSAICACVCACDSSVCAFIVERGEKRGDHYCALLTSGCDLRSTLKLFNGSVPGTEGRCLKP